MATFFSVVIPLYNKEATIKRTIRSVLNQTVQDFEIVVVDDGSSDKGPAAVKTIDDPRIRLFHQKNQGVSAARNRGMAEAKHELIAFLDADDEWLPEFLETIRGLLLAFSGCSLFASNYFFKMPDGTISLPKINCLSDSSDNVLIKNYFVIASCSDPLLWTSAIVVKKNAINNIGGFPYGIGLGEDLLTWARIALKTNIGYSKKPLAIYYRRSAEARITPLRPPPEEDFVGHTLKDLLKQNKNVAGLREYVSQWYSMRLNLFAKFGMCRKALIEFIKITKIAPFNFRAYFWLLVAALPMIISKLLMRLLVRKHIFR